ILFKKMELEEIQAFIKKVKEYNVRIAFDDIGMENINFTNLFQLDVDFLKLESRLVRNMETDKNALEFVKLICSFAQSRDLEIMVIHMEKEATIKLAQGLGKCLTKINVIF
ncbi:MAG: EAL domain-containing protein, partial [Sulfurimonas sp.]|nr:EAL domain-containing protein [Sulfurimonas sp.]